LSDYCADKDTSRPDLRHAKRIAFMGGMFLSFPAAENRIAEPIAGCFIIINFTILKLNKTL